MKKLKSLFVILTFICTAFFKENCGAQNIVKPYFPSQPVIVNEQMPDSMANFVFKDSLNRDIRLSDFKGKYVIIDFWYSGCGACIHCNDSLRVVHEKFKDKNIVFVSLSIDKTREKWIQGITKGAKRTDVNNWAGMYWPAPGTIPLYTGGSGYKNSFIDKYVPCNCFPQLMLIDPKGKILSNSPPRPDVDRKKFEDFIDKLL